MSSPLQAIRGMNDILPADAPYWQRLHQAAARIFQAYGYAEIRLPLVERSELFKRAVGEDTDIVEKEMYSFEDRNGDSLSLRPEGTAGCVRAGIEHGLFYNQQQRLWYAGPMFRHERPQKGRYRQFHQLGVEAFGYPGPDIDLELLLICARLWRVLGISGLRLKLNSLGRGQTRQTYREKLVAYFEAHAERLDEDSQRRLVTNPLRILDSKNPEMQALIAEAPSLPDYLDEESAEHFAALCQGLDDAGIEYEVDPRLVRGLDYYSRTVFEWVTDELGAQDAVCSGGRFDGLVELLGGPETPATGFAIGAERIIELMRLQNVSVEDNAPQAYFVLVGAAAQRLGVDWAERLREQLPGLRLIAHAGGGGFKNQLKRADKSGARLALIMGEAEADAEQVQVKPLREQTEQTGLPLTKLAADLARRLDLDIKS